jgi:hypothetical protein
METCDSCTYYDVPENDSRFDGNGLCDYHAICVKAKQESCNRYVKSVVK